MEPTGEAEILESWRRNALPWTKAIRRGQVESRKLVTDAAIVDAILGRSPRSVLDIGCGEGWLARRLAAESIRVTGIDAVPALIDQARAMGGGEFLVASYDDLAARRLEVLADVVVCNFSLLGDESVRGVFRAVPEMLHPKGAFIVQTLHPVTTCGDLPYEDGWRPGSWDGIGAELAEPAPWHFKTLDSWRHLFLDNALELLETREPLHPLTQEPASVIFIGQRVAQ
jgi:2-polyprenyl-3-methyl-5-hydroxy-6-metoxy-1,4-benzoquinol methylase